MRKAMLHIDWKSILGWSGTSVGTIYTIQTKDEVVFILTCLVAVTTVVYNLIKIFKALKK